MTGGPPHLDPIERLMAEAGSARRAGVFGRTSLDMGALVAGRRTEASWLLRHRHALVGLPVAACLALVVLVGMFHSGGREGGSFGPALVSSSSRLIVLDVAADRVAESTASCFTGPGCGPVAPGCEVWDADADGDVDLRDLSVHQLRGRVGP